MAGKRAATDGLAGAEARAAKRQRHNGSHDVADDDEDMFAADGTAPAPALEAELLAEADAAGSESDAEAAAEDAVFDQGISDDEGDAEDRKPDEDDEAYQQRRAAHIQQVQGEDTKSRVAYDDGVRIEPFNLRSEREHGYFDHYGHYVEARGDGGASDGGDNDDAGDQDEREAATGGRSGSKDAWLAALEESEQAAEQAAAERVVGTVTQAKLDRARTEQATATGRVPAMSAASRLKEAEDHAAATPVDRVVLSRKLAGLLQAGENVKQALRRCKKQADLASLANITDLAAELLASGYQDVYEDTREAMLSRADGTHAARQRGGGGGGGGEERLWEYKWSPEDGKVFAAFTTAELQQWRRQNWFGPDKPIYLRPAGSSISFRCSRDLPQFQ